jgi:ATP-dependent Clp protease ATP-binding subunit ClpC
MGHEYIGTEHLLLGLIHEREGIAARALMELGVSLEAVRERIEETVGRTTGEPTGNPPFTPRAKKVLELSLREALQLGHSYIGTEHLLLGIVREGEGVAARVLEGLGFDLPRVRQSVIQVMSGYRGGAMGEVQSAFFDPSDPPRCAGCSIELELVLRYRTITVPPTSPNPFPLKVDVVFCNRCGKVAAMLRAESTG